MCLVDMLIVKHTPEWISGDFGSNRYKTTSSMPSIVNVVSITAKHLSRMIAQYLTQITATVWAVEAEGLTLEGLIASIAVFSFFI